MRIGNRHFPGTDRETSEGYERDVATDEKAMIDRIAELRLTETSSLEAIGYLIGANPAQLSRYLKGIRGTTPTNYLTNRASAGIPHQINPRESRSHRGFFAGAVRFEDHPA